MIDNCWKTSHNERGVCLAMSDIIRLVLLVTTIVAKNEAARILAVYPTPSLSHQIVFRPLTLELLRRGHEVLVITTDPMFKTGEAPANLTEIDLHDLSYSEWNTKVLIPELINGNTANFDNQVKTIYEVVVHLFEKQMSMDAVQRITKDKTMKFDLLIVEACHTMTLGFSHVFKVPLIQVSSFGSTSENLAIVGASAHPFFYSTIVQQKTYELSFWDKIKKLVIDLRFELMLLQYESQCNEIIKKVFGSDTPVLRELKNNVDMLFLNVHPVWESNRPVPPNVVHLGGMHQKPGKALPKVL
jgi:glucuronosyltransferase